MHAWAYSICIPAMQVASDSYIIVIVPMQALINAPVGWLCTDSIVTMTKVIQTDIANSMYYIVIFTYVNVS